ncbi:MAG: hypothetical protein JW702_05625 [Clostridiales bacterium]|nr:hypothetical protein [Clostridiales bacterium]
MQLSFLPYFLFSFLLIAISLGMLIHFSKKKIESNYEKEMKFLRKFQVSGQIDRKTFFSLKNRLKIQNLSSEQETKLEEMLRNEKIDSITHNRLKKAMQIQLNQKLNEQKT